MIAPPLYVMTTQTLERAEGLAKLSGALGKIKDLIEEAGGVFNVKQQVRKCYVCMHTLELSMSVEHQPNGRHFL